MSRYQIGDRVRGRHTGEVGEVLEVRRGQLLVQFNLPGRGIFDRALLWPERVEPADEVEDIGEPNPERTP